jgi:hypothetical protein
MELRYAVVEAEGASMAVRVDDETVLPEEPLEDEPPPEE